MLVALVIAQHDYVAEGLTGGVAPSLHEEHRDDVGPAVRAYREILVELAAAARAHGEHRLLGRMLAKAGAHDADIAVGAVGDLELDHDLQHRCAVGRLGRMPRRPRRLRCEEQAQRRRLADRSGATPAAPQSREPPPEHHCRPRSLVLVPARPRPLPVEPAYITPMPQQVLVTGGAGYIGSHVCKALAEQGFTPVCYDTLEKGHRWAVRWGPLERGDIGDGERLDEVFVRHRPRAVVHLAGYIEV